jgi:hypothetical protein
MLFIDGGHGKVALMGMHTLLLWSPPGLQFLKLFYIVRILELQGTLIPSLPSLEDG